MAPGEDEAVAPTAPEPPQPPRRGFSPPIDSIVTIDTFLVSRTASTRRLKLTW